MKKGRSELQATEVQEVEAGASASEPGAKLPLFVVLDKTTVVVPQLGNAKSILLKFLADSVQTGDLVGLLSITKSGVTVAHQPGTPLAVLAAALERLDSETKVLKGDFHSPLAQSVDASSKPLVDAELESLRHFGEPEEPFSRSIDAAFAQLRGLQHLANGMRRMPGRKRLLLITRGLPLTLMEGQGRVYFKLAGTPQNLAPDMRTTTTPLRPADPDAQQYGDRQYAQENLRLTGEYERAVEMLNEARVTLYPLLIEQRDVDIDPIVNTLATATAGKYFTFQSDLGAAAKAAAADGGTYYMIACEVPPSKDSDVQWAKLNVDVKKPGAKVRHPQGYFVMPAPRP